MMLNEHLSNGVFTLKKQSIIDKILWTVGIILICGGIGSMIFNSNYVQSRVISHNQEKVAKRISPKTIKQNQKNSGNFNASATKEATGGTVLKNQINSGHIPAIGLMSVPKYHIYNPILNGYGDSNGSYLALGACTMFANEKMGQGNYALAGHHMKSNTIFHSLGKVKNGDKVYTTDMNKIYVYQVYSNKIVNRTEMQVFYPPKDGKPMITMITCTSLAETPYRDCVQGTLVNTLPANQSNLKKYFQY